MILLALIKFRSHWLFGEPNGAAERDYPVGWHETANKGLYKQGVEMLPPNINQDYARFTAKDRKIEIGRAHV